MTRNSLNGFALVGVLLLAGGIAFAQGGGQPQQQGKTIFDYPELNLTDQQKADIAQLVSDLASKNKVNNAKLVIIDEDVKGMLADEKGDLKAVKAKLDEAAAIQVQMRCDDIEAARAINSKLSESQLAAWRVIQGKAAGTIFGYQKELNLTDEQVKSIRTILQNLAKSLNDTKVEIARMQIELEDLLSNDAAKIDDIRAKLGQIVQKQNEMRMQDIMVSREINKVLSDSQLAAWKEIQKNARKAAPPKGTSDK